MAPHGPFRFLTQGSMVWCDAGTTIMPSGEHVAVSCKPSRSVLLGSEAMSTTTVATMDDVRKAESIIHQHVTPAPIIRSYALERELGLPTSRRVWLKDYGWTQVGSFKLLGALNWMAANLERIGDRPVTAHSSGNFE